MAIDPTKQAPVSLTPWALPALPGIVPAVVPQQTQANLNRPLADATQLPAALNNGQPTPNNLQGWEAQPTQPLQVEGALLKRGGRSEEVATLQRALQAAGQATEADGRFGTATATAVRAFQQQAGLKVDGVAGPHTKSALEAMRQVAQAQAAVGANAQDAREKATAALQAAANHLARIPEGEAQALRQQLVAQAQAMGLTFPQADATARRPDPAPEALPRPEGGDTQPTPQDPAATAPQGQEEVRREDGLNLVQRQGKWVRQDVAQAFDRMAAAAKQDGVTLTINSAYRSKAHQQQLWEAALRKYGSAAKARKWVAPPGNSRHQAGNALDIANQGRAHAWLRQNGAKFGFNQPMSWEPWHWELGRR